MENVGVGGVVPVAWDVVADHGWLGLWLGVKEVVVVVVKWWSVCDVVVRCVCEVSCLGRRRG